MKKNHKFFSDIILNISAAGIVALVTQLFVYPALNKYYSPNTFGNILVIMSVVNIVSVVLGNSLNNIRLIYDKNYKKEKIKGDFSLLLLISLFTNILLISTIVFIAWPKESLNNVLILITVSIFTMLRVYLSVEYRLQLNFKKICMHSILYCLSLLLGTMALKYTDIWPIVFLIGEFISFLYLAFTTNLLKEKIIITKKFKKTSKEYMILSISSLIGNLLIYLDRIIILPFLGAHSVAIFFAATVIGKMSSFVISPISGVILSYLSSKTKQITFKEFSLINLMLLIFSGIITIVSYYISTPLLKIIYPDIFRETLDILFLANLAVILQMCSMIPQTILLKYSSSSYQILIQTCYGLIYLIGGAIMIYTYGLKGFCIAAIIAAIFKFILIFGIGYKKINKNLNY